MGQGRDSGKQSGQRMPGREGSMLQAVEPVKEGGLRCQNSTCSKRQKNSGCLCESFKCGNTVLTMFKYFVTQTKHVTRLQAMLGTKRCSLFLRGTDKKKKKSIQHPCHSHWTWSPETRKVYPEATQNELTCNVLSSIRDPSKAVEVQGHQQASSCIVCRPRLHTDGMLRGYTLEVTHTQAPGIYFVSSIIILQCILWG